MVDVKKMNDITLLMYLADSILLAFEMVAMYVLTAYLCPIKFLWIVMAFIIVEMTPRLYAFGIPSAKEHCGMLMLGRIPMIVLILRSSGLSTAAAFATSVIYVGRMVIFLIDYFLGGPTYFSDTITINPTVTAFNKSQKLKNGNTGTEEERQVKLNLNIGNDWLDVNTVKCASEQSEVMDDNSVDYASDHETMQSGFIENSNQSNNSVDYAFDHEIEQSDVEESTIQSDSSVETDYAFDHEVEQYEVKENSIQSYNNLIKEATAEERVHDTEETKAVEEEAAEKDEVKDSIDQKDEELNELQCKCDDYIVELYLLREENNNLKLEKALLEIELHKATEGCKKARGRKKEVKKILHSSLYYGKQLLKWEAEKEELIAQLKCSNSQDSVDENMKDGEEYCDEEHGNEADACEKKDVHKELEAANKILERYHRKKKKFAEERSLWEKEKNDLNARLFAATSSYQQISCVWSDLQRQYNRLAEERNDLHAKLFAATVSAESYKASSIASEEIGRRLREENAELSAKLFSETVSAERFLNSMQEFEEKCRKLEEEKINLSASLSAAKATAEIYRSYMHNYGD